MAEYTLKDNGNTLWIDPEGSSEHGKTMFPGTWNLRFMGPPVNRFYLERITDFKLPEVLYGNLAERSDRIINTFLSREENTGVLFSGVKGS